MKPSRTRSFGQLVPTPNSKAIRRMGFARERYELQTGKTPTGTVLVEFRNGKTYYYAKVSRNDWLMAKELVEKGQSARECWDTFIKKDYFGIERPYKAVT